MLQKKTLSFPHHILSGTEPAGVARIQSPQLYQALASSSADVVAGLQKRGVAKILYIHGTFAGNDLTGLARNLGRLSPTLTRQLRIDQTIKEWSKRSVDSLSGSQGNFPEAYVTQVNQFLQSGQSDSNIGSIEASRFAWSGENHHLGRLHGSLCLHQTLRHLKSQLQENQRILIFAHSHGGNLLALLTLLAESNAKVKRKLLRHLSISTPVAPPTAVSPHLGDSQNPNAVNDLATLLNHCSDLPNLDVITLGTPLRYRWSSHPQRKILHLINHQVVDPKQPTRTAFPSLLKPLDLRTLGDLIQQLGIGGSDFIPAMLTPTEIKQEKKLAKILESSVRRKDYFKKLSLGRRESRDGESILMDYTQIEPLESQKLLGHAVYTLDRLIPFHLALASREMNQDQQSEFTTD